MVSYILYPINYYQVLMTVLFCYQVLMTVLFFAMERKQLEKENFLGRGRHGRVYSASSSNHTPQRLAVKSAFASHSSLLAKEKRVLDELQHCPEIIHCYGDDSAMEDGVETYILFLEYAPGGSLADLILNSGGALMESDARLYTRMIVKGLCHIHEKGYVHCDIKPSNILVFPREGGGNEVKISDFGLSKRVEEERALQLPQLSGTPAYMSPESVVYREDEPPLDVWSVGIMVVEMVTGKLVWRKLGKEDLLFSIVFEQPEIPENMSEDGKDFMRRCFKREAKERWTARMLLNHPFIVEKPTTSMDGEASHFDWSLLQLPSASTGSSSSPIPPSNSLLSWFFSSVQSFFTV